MKARRCSSAEGVGALPLADWIAQVCFGSEGHGALLSCDWLIDGFQAIRFLWMRKGEARFREKRNGCVLGVAIGVFLVPGHLDAFEFAFV